VERSQRAAKHQRSQQTRGSLLRGRSPCRAQTGSLPCPLARMQIPTRVEVFVGLNDDDPGSLKRLGYLSFDPNDRRCGGLQQQRDQPRR